MCCEDGILVILVFLVGSSGKRIILSNLLENGFDFPTAGCPSYAGINFFNSIENYVGIVGIFNVRG